MGRERKKEAPRIRVDTKLSRRSFQKLLQKAKAHTLWLKSLGVLGDSQLVITRNLLRLLERTSSVNISNPRMTLNKRTGVLLKSLREVEATESVKRKTVSRIVFAIINNQDSLSRPAVQTVDAFLKAKEMRAGGKSYRAISRALTESGIQISKNSVMRILKNKHFLGTK